MKKGKKTKRQPRWVAVMAVDPGGTTGVAWGVYDLSHKSIADMLAAGEMTGCAQVTGAEEWQAAKIVEHWVDFEMFARHKYGADPLLVFEDFILRVGKGSSERAGLSPVRITSLVYGLLLGHHVGTAAPWGEDAWEAARRSQMIPWKLQQPSAAKSFATKDRLKRWGLWQVGMQHARDAWRHVALALAEYDTWKAKHDAVVDEVSR
jgi:hypothetical protein